MGLFNFLRKKRLSSESQQVIDNFKHQIDNIHSHSPQPMSAEEYTNMREQEIRWLEKHYDFNSIKGIQAIPDIKNPPKPPNSGVTGEVYYYLRKKAHEHEETGHIELAIECLKKSNCLLRRKYGATYGKRESYSLVGLLARTGAVEEAYREKEYLDNYYGNGMSNAYKDIFLHVLEEAHVFETDLLIMAVQGHASSEMAKYQGRVFSISGKSKIFPKLPEFIIQTGCLENGEPASLFPYQHNITNPNLENTLSVHPLKNIKYGKDIIAFSNRPFVDDRIEEYRQESAQYQAALCAKQTQKADYEASIVEREAARGINQRNYKWVQEHIPDKCPKSFSGYMRMKKGQTKNFLILQKLANEQGRDL